MTTKHNKFCVPICGKTLAEFISNLLVAQQKFDFIELRVDWINDLKPKDLMVIKNHLTVSAIVTCRSSVEKGGYSQGENNRYIILQTAIDLGFSYVDIELEHLKNFRFSTATKIIA